MPDPIQNAVKTEPPSPPPRTDRPRPYIPLQPAIPPDYARFCEVHTRHRALWRLTYSPDRPAPYRADHRHSDSISLAASNLDALDFALSQFAPPLQRPRPYLNQPDRIERRDQFGDPERPPQPVPTTPAGSASPASRPSHAFRSATALDLREAQCLHQMADDLAASTDEHTYWTSAVREAAVEILARVAALLGDNCGRRAPVTHDPGTRPLHLGCLRPATHEGAHLDASGRTWPNSGEGDR